MRAESLMVKAKRADIGSREWITGFVTSPYMDNLCHFNYMEGLGDWRECKIDGDTICRPTGQTDRFDNKIYENDILVDEEGFLVVRWDEDKSAFVFDSYGFPEYLTESGIEETSSRFSLCETLDFDDFCTLDHLVIVGNTIDNPEFKKDGTLPKEAVNKVRIAYLSNDISVTQTCLGDACFGICYYEGKTYSIELVPDERNAVDICWQMAEHIVAELDKEEAERDDR